MTARTERVWRIRLRGKLSATVAEALPDVSVVDVEATTLVESSVALASAIDQLQAFGLEVMEVHEATARGGRARPGDAG